MLCIKKLHKTRTPTNCMMGKSVGKTRAVNHALEASHQQDVDPLASTTLQINHKPTRPPALTEVSSILW